jgi:hypothetical protein
MQKISCRYRISDRNRVQIALMQIKDQNFLRTCANLTERERKRVGRKREILQYLVIVTKK